jgi:hypothetical protein
VRILREGLKLYERLQVDRAGPAKAGRYVRRTLRT